MRALLAQLKIRILAGLVLAVAGNSSAASNIDRDVLQFRPISPVMRPQGKRTAVKRAPVDPDDEGILHANVVNTVLPPVAAPAVQQPAPVVQQPAPVVQQPAPAIQQPVQSPPTFTQPVFSAAQPPVVAAPVSSHIPLPEARPAIAEPDTQTAATVPPQAVGFCPTGTCNKFPRTGGLSTQAANIKDVNDAMKGGTGDKNLLNRLAIAAVKDAVKKRNVASMCGGGSRVGNRSKCMCASGVKEALQDSGACPRYLSGDAVNIAGLPHGTTDQLSRTGPVRSRGLASVCPAFHQIKGRMPRYRDSLSAAENAPAGSVIVYSTSRHAYGHIETKIQVTAENIGQISRNLKVQLGQFLYCSDFCRTGPTFSHETNRVEAIYSL